MAARLTKYRSSSHGCLHKFIPFIKFLAHTIRRKTEAVVPSLHSFLSLRVMQHVAMTANEILGYSPR